MYGAQLTSPKGRWVVELAGDAGTIRSRGQQITRLGNQMATSATFLSNLAADASGMKGEAVEKLQEIVGESYVQLGQAAELYKPIGPILVDYAGVLDEYQPRIRVRVQNCTDTRTAYESAPGFRQGSRPFWAQPAPWRSEEEKQTMGEANDTEDLKKEQLWEAYQSSLVAFDNDVDSWEELFDDAASRVEASFDGKIKDSFWDNVDGFVAVAVEVLKVAGMIVAIAGIIIGGPIIGAIAAVISVATLALVAYQFIRGDANGWDLGLAIVGVIPFGSLGKLANGKQGLIDIAGDTFKAFKPSTWSAAAGQWNTLKMAHQLGGGGLSGFSSGASKLWTMSNPNGIGDIMSRFMFGKDVNSMTGTIENMLGGSRGWENSPVFPAAWEFTHTLLYSGITTTENLARIPGLGDASLTSQFPWLKIFK